jgi:hypothetical protein
MNTRIETFQRLIGIIEENRDKIGRNNWVSWNNYAPVCLIGWDFTVNERIRFVNGNEYTKGAILDQYSKRNGFLAGERSHVETLNDGGRYNELIIWLQNKIDAEKLIEISKTPIEKEICV